MSYVTNVMVTGLGAHSIVTHLNKWLTQEDIPEGNTYGSLLRVDEHAGGSKALETNVYLGAFNYLNIGEFVEVFKNAMKSKEVRGSFPDTIQLFICDQNDNHFHQFYP